MAASHIFKVVFHNQGKVYEIYARKVGHGSLFGFVEVEELIFGERSAVVVDPAEERIKSEFAGRQAHLPAAALRDPHRRGQEERRQQGLGGRRLQRHAVPVPRLSPPGDPGSRR